MQCLSCCLSLCWFSLGCFFQPPYGADDPFSAEFVAKSSKKPRNGKDSTKTTYGNAQRQRLRNMNVWLINIRGLRSNIGQLQARIRVVPPVSRPDLILITESKLDSSVPGDSSNICIDGYSHMRRDRSDDSAWGGCIVYYKNGLPIVRETNLEPKSHELMVFSIQSESGIVLISAAYCPPKKVLGTLEWYENNLDHLISRTKASICILAGDFNCHHREWLGSRSPTDEEGKFALNMCNSYGLTQIVNGPTHKLGNCLDLIMTDAPNLLSSIEIDSEIGTSDHYTVKAAFEVSSLSESSPPRYVWLYKKADWDGLRCELAATPWNELLNKDDPETSCSNVTHAIQNVMKSNIPQKAVRPFVNYPEWWNEKCEEALKKKNSTWRRWKALQTPESRLAYNQARNTYTSISRKAISLHKAQVRGKMTEELKTGSKSWWWTARRLAGQGGKSEIPVLKANGRTYITSEDKAECFSSLFCEKSTIPEEDNNKDIPQLHQRTFTSCSRVVFWPSKVKKQLINLDTSKATGPDDIPALVLKMAAPELAKPLARLFQLCFDSGYMPAQWKCANVIPCYKKGDKHTPGNYRPISLLSIMSKVMEKLISKKMWKHLDQHHLISIQQFGFRAGHSTSDALTYVSQSLTNCLNNREEARVVCLDISRAFDRVWHPGLLTKLAAFGFSGTLLAWLTDYLQDRSLKVVLNGQESSIKKINAGVPQGSILGPLLFIIFIDDISQDLANQSILYADDATIMSFIRTKADRHHAAASLNQDLAKIEEWAKSWNVLFGAAKCKSTTISNRKDAVGNHPPLNFFGSTLEEVDHVDLLGLTLSNDLSWNQVVTKMAKTAGQKLGFLRRVSPYILPAQRAIIYKSMIRSKMEYASSAWMGATPTSLAQLDSIQNRAKRIIGLPVDELKASRIQPLSDRRAVGATTLFHRIFYKEAPELLCQLMPKIQTRDPRLRRSVRDHDLAVVVPRSNLVSHERSFLPSTARLWNSLPSYIPAIKPRASFSREVNSYLGDSRSAAPRRF